MERSFSMLIRKYTSEDCFYYLYYIIAIKKEYTDRLTEDIDKARLCSIDFRYWRGGPKIKVLKISKLKSPCSIMKILGFKSEFRDTPFEYYLEYFFNCLVFYHNSKKLISDVGLRERVLHEFKHNLKIQKHHAKNSASTGNLNREELDCLVQDIQDFYCFDLSEFKDFMDAKENILKLINLYNDTKDTRDVVLAPYKDKSIVEINQMISRNKK